MRVVLDDPVDTCWVLVPEQILGLVWIEPEAATELVRSRFRGGKELRPCHGDLRGIPVPLKQCFRIRTDFLRTRIQL
jgi:hypothetical protein